MGRVRAIRPNGAHLDGRDTPHKNRWQTEAGFHLPVMPNPRLIAKPAPSPRRHATVTKLFVTHSHKRDWPDPRGQGLITLTWTRAPQRRCVLVPYSSPGCRVRTS